MEQVKEVREIEQARRLLSCTREADFFFFADVMGASGIRRGL